MCTSCESVCSLQKGQCRRHCPFVTHFLCFAALAEGVLAAEVDAAGADVHDLDPGHVTGLEHVLDLLGALEFEVLDLDQSVLAGSQLHPRAEVGADVADLAVVQGADLGLKDDVLDGLAGGAAGLDVGGGDEDGAVVADVDLAAGVGGDLLDDLAAGADAGRSWQAHVWARGWP